MLIHDNVVERCRMFEQGIRRGLTGSSPSGAGRYHAGRTRNGIKIKCLSAELSRRLHDPRVRPRDTARCCWAQGPARRTAVSNAGRHPLSQARLVSWRPHAAPSGRARRSPAHRPGAGHGSRTPGGQISSRSGRATQVRHSSFLGCGGQGGHEGARGALSTSGAAALIARPWHVRRKHRAP